MQDDLRQNLDKMAGDLLENFITLDKTSIRNLRANLRAADIGRQDIDQNSVVPSALEQALAAVGPELKNALLAGKESQRALLAMERASSILSSSAAANKELVLKGVLYNYHDKEKPARIDMEEQEHNPHYLIAAKATSHLAELLESGVALAPKVITEDAVADALKTIKLLSIKVLVQTAEQLKKAGTPESAERVNQMARQLAKEQHHDEGGAIGTMEGALRVMQKGLDRICDELKDQKILSEAEAEAFGQLVTTRLEQIRR